MRFRRKNEIAPECAEERAGVLRGAEEEPFRTLRGVVKEVGKECILGEGQLWPSVEALLFDWWCALLPLPSFSLFSLPGSHSVTM